MSSSATLGFDLVHEPWIPCRERDGTIVEQGLLRTLGRAHELAGISGDVATQVFALTRLLLAVLHRALDGPPDVDGWDALWRSERLPVDRIARYLGAHHERFDLLHPETPFLQVAGLRTAKDGTSGLAALIADVPNGERVFSSRRGRLSLSLPEAARWVVHCQAFDPSGIKSGAADDQRVKGGRGYPIGVGWSGLLGGLLVEGTTLKETLLLNLISFDFSAVVERGDRDRPVWERDPLIGVEEVAGGRLPRGPVDLYTWPSRRIRLVTTGDRVTDVLITNGDKLTPQNMQRFEPHTAWRKSDAQAKKAGAPSVVYMPREHDPERAIWRGLQALLPAHSSRQKQDAGRFLSPGILEWVGHLSYCKVIERRRTVRVRAIGMIYGSNSSVTAELVHDTLDLPALLVRQDAENLSALVSRCIEAGEAVVLALGNLAGDLAAAAGGDGTGTRSRQMEQGYADLEPEFRAWLLTLGPDADETGLEADWHRRVSRVVQALADDLLSSLPPASWKGRMVRGRRMTAAHAEARYWKALRVAVPSAFPDRHDGPEAA